MALRADDVDLGRDRDLVVRSQAGDDGAFEDLYRRYFGRLYRYCLRRVGDPHEAEELAQEAFARAYGALPRLAGERRFYPWLSVIANRLCADEFRRRARSEPAAVIDLGAGEGGQERVLQAVDEEILGQAMRRLTPRHRQVLDLREQDGWSYQHIAEHMGVSLGTVEALLHRARRALKREFDRLSGPDLAPAGVGAGSLGWLGRRIHAVRSRLRVEEWLDATWAPAVGNAVAAAVVVVASSTLVGNAGAAPSVTVAATPAAASQEAPAPEPEPAADAAAKAPPVATEGSTSSPAASSSGGRSEPPAPTRKGSDPDVTVDRVSLWTYEETHGDEGRKRAEDQQVGGPVGNVIVGTNPEGAVAEAGATAEGWVDSFRKGSR